MEKHERDALKPASDTNTLGAFDVVGLLGDLKNLPKTNSMSQDRLNPVVTNSDGSQSLFMEPLDFGDSHRSTRGVPKHDKTHDSTHQEKQEGKGECGEGFDKQELEKQAYKAYGKYQDDPGRMHSWMEEHRKQLGVEEFKQLLLDLDKISHRPEHLRQHHIIILADVDGKHQKGPSPPQGTNRTFHYPGYLMVIPPPERPSALLPANVNVQRAGGAGNPNNIDTHSNR